MLKGIIKDYFAFDIFQADAHTKESQDGNAWFK